MYEKKGEEGEEREKFFLNHSIGPCRSTLHAFLQVSVRMLCLFVRILSLTGGCVWTRAPASNGMCQPLVRLVVISNGYGLLPQ